MKHYAWSKHNKINERSRSLGPKADLRCHHLTTRWHHLAKQNLLIPSVEDGHSHAAATTWWLLPSFLCSLTPTPMYGHRNLCVIWRLGKLCIFPNNYMIRWSCRGNLALLHCLPPSSLLQCLIFQSAHTKIVNETSSSCASDSPTCNPTPKTTATSIVL